VEFGLEAFLVERLIACSVSCVIESCHMYDWVCVCVADVESFIFTACKAFSWECAHRLFSLTLPDLTVGFGIQKLVFMI
jgi:hypothetical protein